MFGINRWKKTYLYCFLKEMKSFNSISWSSQSFVWFFDHFKLLNSTLTWPRRKKLPTECRETLLSNCSMIYFCGSRDIYILWPLGAAFLETCWWQSVYRLPVNHWYFNIYLYREFFFSPWNYLFPFWHGRQHSLKQNNLYIWKVC